ncbi:M16 family metallopeptidase, partial [Archangium sp.]|uniref:M16 family metallopeptidase n=1 Tax=Archangium sp. TaxID=1872627 RepID=UPI002EDA1E05
GTLRSGARPDKPQVAEVKHTREQIIRHDEKVGTLPMVTLAWLTPPYFGEGDATADVLANALGTGKSSRLYKRLVLEKGLATSVSASQQSLGAQSVFSLEAVARPGISSDALVKELDAVLDEVRRDGISQQDLNRARTRFETQMLAGLQSVGGFGGKADVLQSYNHYVNDPGYLDEDLARYDAVTTDSVRDFARQYLKPDARVVLHAVPTPKAPVSSAKELH